METADTKKTFGIMNTLIGELNKEQIPQKMVESGIEYVKNKMKPYYLALVFLLIAILIVVLYTSYKLFNAK